MTMRIEGEKARLNVPVSYPSGAGGIVEVTYSEGTCFVSDMGTGYMEAEGYGAAEYYGPSARKAAERFGVKFDGLCIFAIWASIDRLEGAIVSVANASAQAAAAAIFRAVEEKEKQRNLELYERVVEIFGVRTVAKTQELKGREAAWNAHNVVLFPSSRRAVFEFVSESQNSIANKFMMFSDLSRVEGAYSLNSVVKSIERIGQKRAMLADVSNVLTLSDAPEAFRRFAEAA
ncbi:MAG: hypothetical protein JNM20_16130 [Rhizobiales bacterium]|nr:hypothetical protein [Hyphomicrobiales bacterium]